MSCAVEKRFLFFRWTEVNHDWEVLSISHKNHVEREVDLANSKSRSPAMPVVPPISSYDILLNRVCLRCGLIDNQIDEYRSVYLDALAVRSERQRKAKAIAGLQTRPESANTD